jgi:predicted GIY-YIG superfamily endonuclease
VSTANKGPWKMVFVRTFTTREDAQKEEKRLKRTNSNYLRWLIDQVFNEVKKFFPE